jgi:phosphoribosylcarboxyaminoimidazole (NCAIR) mutase
LPCSPPNGTPIRLVDVGRERDAASLALGALSRHPPRYNRSLVNYARALREEPEE